MTRAEGVQSPKAGVQVRSSWGSRPCPAQTQLQRACPWVCLASRAQGGAAWGWLDRLCDCSRSHGRLSLSAPHTAPNSSDFCPCSPHSSSAWTSLPQSLPRSREHRVSRAHQPFPLLFPPPGALWAGTDLRRVCAGAWHRVGTRPGTRQALSQ